MSVGNKLLHFLSVFSVVFVVVAFLTSPVLAATTDTISFQSKVVNSDGTNIPNNTYNFRFIMYSVSSGGSSLWQEDKSISIVDGVLSTQLGSGTAFPSALFDNADLYLQICFDANGTDLDSSNTNCGGSTHRYEEVFGSRKQITAVPVAFRAKGLVDGTGTPLLVEDIYRQGGNSFGVTAVLGTKDANPLQLIANNTTAVTILSNGNVGIGATSPGQKLTVDGSLGIIEGGTSPTYHTIFQGGDQSADITYTLPTSVGISGQVLSTDGSGVLSWVTGGTGGGSLFNSNGTVLNGDYIEVAHNTDSFDVLSLGWYQDAVTGLWRQLENTSKSITHDLSNEFNPAFTHKKKTTSVSLNYNENDLGTGADGPITVSVNTSINTTSLIAGRSCADGGDAVNYSVIALTSLTAQLESTPSAGCLAIGDEVLLINLRGTASAYGNVGNYETFRIVNIVGDTITFSTAKSKYYGDGLSNDTNIGVGTGAQAVMLQRIPNYSTVTINAGISFYPDLWTSPTGAVNNGAGEGGVMFFRANGAVAVNGTLTAAGRGYKGGAYLGDLAAQQQGESTTGAGGATYVAKAEGGGGGSGANCTGGGGGGYAVAGGTGGRSGTSCSSAGVGGGIYPTAGNSSLSRLYLGSGGGAGGTGYVGGVWTYDGGGGGNGGGVVYVAANSITVSGAATSSGGAGGAVGDLGGSDITQGGGGGGAGGSLKFIANTIALGASLTTAAGGSGGSTGYSNYGSTYSDLGGYAYGGNGGAGYVSLYYATSLTGSSSPTYSAQSLAFNTYAVFNSQIIETPKATSYGNISWTENLATYGEIQVQTRSGATTDPTDGTWSAWGPTTSQTLLQNADTHTDWTGSNGAVSDGDVTRDVKYYEDEDEAVPGNITKMVNAGTNGYIDATISPVNISSYDYVTFWVRSSVAGNKIKIGLGEATATEQEEVVTINTANVWQKVYWDISDITGTSRDAVTKLRVTGTDNGQIFYIDTITAGSYLTNNAGSAITSAPNKYIQYRVVLSTTNAAYTPTISGITLQYTNATGTYAVDADRIRNTSDMNYDQSVRFFANEYELDDYKSIYTMVTPTEVSTTGGIDTGNGADGNVTVSVSTNINTTNLIAGRSCADGGDAVNYSVIALTSTTAELESTPSAGCLAIGDEVLLINLRGNATSVINVGNYETLRVNSIVADTITFSTAKSKFYGDGVTDDTNVGIGTGAQAVMLQRVPNYANLTVNAGISFYPDAWVAPNGAVHNGAGEGGVMFFRANGAASINGTITVASRGYIGGVHLGIQVQQQQGESTSGSGGATYVAKSEGGGGGSQGYCTGGGGGAYGTGGTSGGRAGTSCPVAGNGASAYPTTGNASLSKLYFGSAGGAGGTGYNGSAWNVAGGTGGNGGGIVHIAASVVTVSGAITANGGVGGSVGDSGGLDVTAGGGGGGAGGSIKLLGNTVNVGSSLATASAGAGGSSGHSDNSSTWYDLGGYAYGGTGGVGIIAIQSGTSLSGATSPSYTTTQAAISSYSLFVSDEIATPNAVGYKAITWLADMATYGKVQLQTRSGPTSNSTDGTWEAWKPFVTNVNRIVLNSMDTIGDWTVSNLNAPADGDYTRNIDYFEDEDESVVGNTTKLASTAATNGYAETTIAAKDISGAGYITLWVRSSVAGNVIKLGIGESAATENEEVVYVSKAGVWQKVYWDISDIDKSQRNAITKLRISILSANTTVYVDSFTSDGYLTDSTGATITSSPNDYIQYRAVLSTTSSVALSPKLHNVHIDWNDGFKVVQVDSNTTRLYNLSGQTQNLRLLVGSGVGGGGGVCNSCFVNGGNAFGNNALLGTNDAYSLSLKTNGVSRFVISSTGTLNAFGNLLPGTDITYSLGSSSMRWKDLYLGPSSLHFVSTSGETTTSRDWIVGIVETDGASEGNLVFKEGANEYLTISKTGSLGIGTTNPGQKLTVEGTLGIIEGGTSPTYHTIIQGGDQTADITYTLPTTTGVNGQVLGTDGAGVLSWVDGGAGGGGVLYTASDAALGDGSYLTVAHNKNTNNLLTTAWVYSQSTWKQIDATYKPAIAWEGKNTQKGLYHDSVNQYATASATSQSLQTMISEGLLFDTFEDRNKTDSSLTTAQIYEQMGDNGASNVIALSDRVQGGRVGLWGNQSLLTSTTDNAGNTYVASNSTVEMKYYERGVSDSVPQVLTEIGIDPNWYNGVTLSSALTSETARYKPNPNLSTTYNGSLVKATGRYSANARAIYVTVKSASTFDWTDNNGNSGTGVTMTPGTAQLLGSTGVSITFTSATYNVGDIFKIASWYVEPTSSVRGDKQQFPERAVIIANAGGVDIIDSDTQKLWMRFLTGANYLISSSPPLTVEFLNGMLYVGTAQGLREAKFHTDNGVMYNPNQYLIGGLSQRNAATIASSGNPMAIVTNQVNDISAKVIPNTTTQEVTVSGWGYIQGTGAVFVEESVALPYKFNSIPKIALTGIGAAPTVAPKSPADCTTLYYTDANAYSATANTFIARLHNTSETAMATTYFICYTWTATGTVSPKQFVAVATGADPNDGGDTIINETDETDVDVLVGNQSAAALWQRKIAITNNNSLYSAAATPGGSWLGVYYSVHGLSNETSWAQYRNGYYYVGQQPGGWSQFGPGIRGASASDYIDALSVTEKTSFMDPNGNTIYVGTDVGLTAIQENRSYGNMGDGSVESFGLAKHYSGYFISEDLYGDIRGMWSLNGMSSDPGGLIDVSIKAHSLSNQGTGNGIASGVRGFGYTSSGTGDLYCTDAACGSTSRLDMGTADFTLGTWVKTSYTTDVQQLVRKGNTAPAYALNVQTTGKARMYLTDGTSTCIADGVTTVADGKWHYLVGTVDRDVGCKVYVDGELDGATNTPVSLTMDSGDNFYLGGLNGTQMLNGVMDEPFVTATLMPQNVIKHLYEVGNRALQSHSGLLGGSADSSQRLAGGSVDVLVSSIESDWSNRYLYVARNNTVNGGLSKVQLNSDTLIKSITSFGTTPAGGPTVPDEDVNSLAVGHELVAAGSAASGAKLVGGTTSTTGNYVSKTYTLSKNIGSAVLWVSPVTDSTDVSNVVAVKASNDGGSNYVTCILVSTDSTQVVPEKEYACEFPTADNDLKVKFEFTRGSAKTSTYVVQYGISWLGESGFRMEQADANNVRLYNFTGETQNVRLGVTGGGFQDVAILWTDGGTYVKPANNESLRIYDALGTNYTELSHDGTNVLFGQNGTTRFKLDASGNFLPGADDTYTLGSSSARWQDIYLGPNSFHISSSVAETSVAGNWSLSILGTPVANPGTGEGNLAFKEGTTTIMTVGKNGNIGIGTVDPSYKLDVSGNARFTGNVSINPTATTTTYTKAGQYSYTGQTGASGAFLSSNSFPTTGSLWWGTANNTSQIVAGTGGVIDLFTNEGTANTEFTPTSRLRVNSNGTVGIGTTSVFTGAQMGVVGGLLYVGNANTPYGANISGSSNGRGIFGSNLYIDGGTLKTLGTHSTYGYAGMDTSWGAINFFTSGDATTAGAAVSPVARMSIATTGYVTFANGHNDLAENYHLTGTALRGSLVSLDRDIPGNVEVSNGTQGHIIGIVSTAPGALMDADGGFVIGPETKLSYKDEKAPIALQGTAPMLVVVDTNTIQVGDMIGASNEMGYGTKVNTGFVIGRAMEQLDYSRSCPAVGSIMDIVWPDDDGKNSLHPCYTLPDGRLVGKVMVAIQPLAIGGGSTVAADSFWTEVSPTVIQSSRDVVVPNITATKGSFSLLNSMTLNINDKFLVDNDGNATAASVSTPIIKGFGSGITVALQPMESFTITAGNTKILEADAEGVKVSSEQAGFVVIPAGQTSATISSIYIKDVSIVLATASKPIPVGVTVNATDKTFIITLDSVKSEDVTVRWFIVNNTAP